jgi:hypothetical protein
MIKYFALTVALVALPAITAGCGGGLSTEDAQAECDDLSQRLASCFDDAVNAECVSCFEDCGVDCDVSDACPATFACPD